jgi:hypothetical protein
LQVNASAAFGGLAGEKFVKVLEVNLKLCKRCDLVFFVPQTKPRALPPNKCILSADHEAPEFNANPHETPINPHETPIDQRNNRI